jgi:hypothetical protein
MPLLIASVIAPEYQGDIAVCPEKMPFFGVSAASSYHAAGEWDVTPK